ncbi:MAG: radical SAM protein [bacterium]
MRLHLGCGDLYIPSALNIDKHDLRVADVQADAVILPVLTGSCDSVTAYHVFEHMGYANAVYALAEAYRVLKPGGILEIETPDPARSFQAFLERSDPRWRADILSWIFGMESPGMGHRVLFPRELLEKLVREAGFSEITLSEPKTHRHRWGFRLVARKDPDPTAHLIALLRSRMVSEILRQDAPQETLEMEIRLWEPLHRLGMSSITPEEAQGILLEWTVLAPRMILLWTGLCEHDHTLPRPPGPFPMERVQAVAQALIDAESCEVLRHAFSVLCATVNQAAQGYEHILAGAIQVVKRWLACPPRSPAREFPRDLEACDVMLDADQNLSYPGDIEVALGQSPIAGRRPRWPRHALFTRQHCTERAKWFRDLGIRCFERGRVEEARRLFRLAINAKVLGVYAVWNMARLQAGLGQMENAGIFYRAALGFRTSDAVKERIVAELREIEAGGVGPAGPVTAGEGEDRVFGILEEEPAEGESTLSIGAQPESAIFPPPRSLLWELTLRCQCRCTHCAAAAGNPRPGELSTEEALSICDQIAALGIPSVCLMGGEPLLHPGWQKIAARIKEHGVDLGLSTNGIALDDTTWRNLEELSFSQVVISLDGATPEIHDVRRKWKGALKAAQRAIEEMATRPLRERTVVTCVDRTNIGELGPVRDWLLEHAPGITWMITMASPSPGSRMEKDHILRIEDFLSMVRFIAENRGKYQRRLDVTGAHCMGYFSQRYQNLHNYTWSGCQAGISTLGLRSDGAVTGCLVMSDHFIEGNVREQGLAGIWKNPGSFSYNRSFRTDMLKGKCASCRWGEICRGGCRETAYSFTGDPFEAPFCLHHLESVGALS